MLEIIVPLIEHALDRVAHGWRGTDLGVPVLHGTDGASAMYSRITGGAMVWISPISL
jgi:hypothetical protein